MKLPKYHNADTCKDPILSENKNKSGIYMWTNSKNGKCYIGSAVDLYYRLSFYFSTFGYGKFIKKKNSKSSIYNALLKYGHEKFELTILEYCDNLRRKMYWKRRFLSILFGSRV